MAFVVPSIAPSRPQQALLSRPVPVTPSSSWPWPWHHHLEQCRRCRRRTTTRRFVLDKEGGSQGQQQQQQQQGPLGELERTLKGEEPPTVYVQQTPQGRMRIPLPPGPNRLLILFSVATALSLGLLAVVVGHFIGVPPLATLSLHPGGVATGCLLALPLVAVDYLLQGVQEDTASEVYSLSIFGTQTPLPAVLGLAAAVTLATGIGEEVLFRGLIQEGLSSVLGGVAGLGAASLAFGLAHKLGPADVAFITGCGAYMGLAQLLTRDLTVPIALHAAYDFLILASAYFRAKQRIGPQGQGPQGPPPPPQ